MSESSKAEKYNTIQLERPDGLLTIQRITELVRHWQSTHDLEPDGMFGQITSSTVDAILAPVAAPEIWEPWPGGFPLDQQPRTRYALEQALGNPSLGGKLNVAWYKEMIVEMHQSHGNRLPGAPPSRFVQLHRLIAPYAREGLRRAQVASPEYVIERIGSYNYRHIRHDVRRPLSMHSYGAAVDIDPHRNFSKVFPKGEAPTAWSPDWYTIWPQGVTRAFVEAMQSCGWAWGADWDEDGQTDDHTFIDPMHFEWRDRSRVRVISATASIKSVHVSSHNQTGGITVSKIGGESE